MISHPLPIVFISTVASSDKEKGTSNNNALTQANTVMERKRLAKKVSFKKRLNRFSVIRFMLMVLIDLIVP